MSSKPMSKEVKAAIVAGIFTLLAAVPGTFFATTAIKNNITVVVNGTEVRVSPDEYQGLLNGLEEENDNLKGELDVLSDQNNKATIESAKSFAGANDYAKALALLNSAAKKTPEMELLISDYTTKYEAQIIEQAITLKADKKYEEAVAAIKAALKILPNSQILKNKLQEVENSFPKNMTDAVPAYESGGNPYKEYSALKSGGTEYFSMGGVKYTNGMTFNADDNIFEDVSWAVYNLGRKYSVIEFVLCHVDGSYIGRENTLHVFYDGVLKEEIPLAPDMSPKDISLDVSGVNQLKLQVYPSGGDGPLYGLGNPMIQ